MTRELYPLSPETIKKVNDRMLESDNHRAMTQHGFYEAQFFKDITRAINQYYIEDCSLAEYFLNKNLQNLITVFKNITNNSSFSIAQLSLNIRLSESQETETCDLCTWDELPSEKKLACLFILLQGSNSPLIEFVSIPKDNPRELTRAQYLQLNIVNHWFVHTTPHYESQFSLFKAIQRFHSQFMLSLAQSLLLENLPTFNQFLSDISPHCPAKLDTTKHLRVSIKYDEGCYQLKYHIHTDLLLIIGEEKEAFPLNLGTVSYELMMGIGDKTTKKSQIETNGKIVLIQLDDLNFASYTTTGLYVTSILFESAELARIIECQQPVASRKESLLETFKEAILSAYAIESTKISKTNREAHIRFLFHYMIINKIPVDFGLIFYMICEKNFTNGIDALKAVFDILKNFFKHLRKHSSFSSDYYQDFLRELVNFANNNQIRIDFSKLDLSHLDLSRFKLNRAIMKESNCEGTKFIGADMTAGFFANTNLKNANFTAANISLANFDWNTIFENSITKDCECSYVYMYFALLPSYPLIYKSGEFGCPKPITLFSDMQTESTAHQVMPVYSMVTMQLLNRALQSGTLPCRLVSGLMTSIYWCAVSAECVERPEDKTMPKYILDDATTVEDAIVVATKNLKSREESDTYYPMCIVNGMNMLPTLFDELPHEYAHFCKMLDPKQTGTFYKSKP